MSRRSYLKGLGLGIFVTALIMSLSSKNVKGEMSDAEIMERASELGMVSENAMLLSEAKEAADKAQAEAMEKATEALMQPESDNIAPLSANAPSSNAAVSINGEISGNKTVSSNGEIIDVPGSSPARSSSSAKASEKENQAGTAGASGVSATSSAKSEASPASDASLNTESVNSDPSGSVQQTDANGNNETESDSSASSEVVIINVSSGDGSMSVATKMVQSGLISDARQFDSYLVLSGYDRRLVVGPHPIPKNATPAEMGAILTSKQ
ncbi:MAG: hypothetical protein IJT96_02915 [Lachnospiraceae bacterium]|nr:hypothetical protein [Lachnospiraceae bacterium]